MRNSENRCESKPRILFTAMTDQMIDGNGCTVSFAGRKFERTGNMGQIDIDVPIRPAEAAFLLR